MKTFLEIIGILAISAIAQIVIAFFGDYIEEKEIMGIAGCILIANSLIVSGFLLYINFN